MAKLNFWHHYSILQCKMILQKSFKCRFAAQVKSPFIFIVYIEFKLNGQGCDAGVNVTCF